MPNSTNIVSQDILDENELLMHSYLELPILDSDRFWQLLTLPSDENFTSVYENLIFTLHFELPKTRITISSISSIKLHENYAEILATSDVSNLDFYIWSYPITDEQIIELNSSKEGDALREFYESADGYMIKLHSGCAKEISTQDFIEKSTLSFEEHLSSYFSSNKILNRTIRDYQRRDIIIEERLFEKIITKIKNLSNTFIQIVNTRNLNLTPDPLSSLACETDEFEQVIRKFESIYLSTKLNSSLSSDKLSNKLRKI